MNVYPRRDLFYRRPTSNLYRLFVIIMLILGGVWLIRKADSGEIKLFQSTPIPTRAAESYALEGEAQFVAGNLQKSIAAYQDAVRVNPDDAQIWAELARIQTYASALETTDPERLARLTDGLASADRALTLAAEIGRAHV